MKTLLTALSLCLVLFGCVAQPITLTDFIAYRTLDHKVFKEQFDNTNFTLDDEEDLNRFLTRTTFKNANNSDEECNIIFINHIDVNKSKIRNRVSFQFKSDELLYSYLVELKKNNFKDILYKEVDRQMIHVYTDDKIAIELIITKSLNIKDVNVYYTFALYNYEEYSTQFAEENMKYRVPNVSEYQIVENAIGL